MELTKRDRWFAMLQLLRLPNVFTAAADVAMGFLVAHGVFQSGEVFALLVTASCLLYLSGTVLNDVFDAEVDRRERPERPIPSGRVSPAAAAALGWALLASGVLVAWLAGYVAGDWRPGAVGTVLAACIVLYDAVLKHTLLGPLLMGACRALNVLLGMSAVPRELTTVEWTIAAAIGVYIVGVTWFARSDADASPRGQLVGGLVVLLAGMAILASLPAWAGGEGPTMIAPRGWYLLWAVLSLIIARRCVVALFEPTPSRVQAAVRHAVHSLIVLDAAVVLGFVGIYWGCAVLLLIFPTMLLTAWLDAT